MGGYPGVMSIAAYIIEAMAAAGCTAKQVAAVVRADEKVQTEHLALKREKERIKKKNQRSRPQLSLGTQGDIGDIKPTAKLALSAVLDNDHASAVVEHRDKLRRPLTIHAAKLLASKFAKCPSPNDAADAMIANGWQGFEPDWMQTRINGHGKAAPKSDFQQHQDAVQAELDKALGRKRHDDFTGPTLDFGPTDFGYRR
jgi:hypothetical protein